MAWFNVITKDADGIAVDVTCLGIDLTERRRTEAKILQLQKAESLGRMAGAIAHHFNNQLAVVQGNLELALDSLSDREATRKFLNNAMQSARRSSEISRMMLTYLGQGEGKGEALDLSGVCRQHVPLLRATLAEGVALETDFMAVGPVVRSTGHQLGQVLTRLVTNAAEAIGDRGGKVTLTTRTIPAADIPESQLVQADWQPMADSYACLEVSDTGCGIGPEDMKKIFDPFFTTKFTGRGLGLAVLMGIVKACDGVVGVESEKDGGSTFRVFLPVAAEAARRPPAFPAAMPASKGELNDALKKAMAPQLD